MKRKILLLTFLFLLLCQTAFAAAGWLGHWKYRIPLKVNSAVVDSDQSNFPIMVKLSTSSGIGTTDVSSVFDELGANSLKIAVTEPDGSTQCYVDVEYWDSASETAYIWFKTTTLDGDDTSTYWLYFDAGQADNTTYVNVSGTDNAVNVWSEYVAVWHMSDNAGNTTVTEATGNYNGTASANTNTFDSTGKIDGALDFEEGTPHTVDVGDNAAFTFVEANPFSVSAWINIESNSANLGILTKHGWDGKFRGEWFFRVRSSNNINFLLIDDSAALWNHIEAYGDTTLNTATDYYVAGTYDGSGANTGIEVYVDGSIETPTRSAGGYVAMEDTAKKVYIGCGDGSLIPFDGDLDEIRIAGSEWSADYVKADYNSGNDSLITYGARQARPAIFFGCNQ